MEMLFFFFQAEDGIRDYKVTGVQTCALPILSAQDYDAVVADAQRAFSHWRSVPAPKRGELVRGVDRKSTRLNSSHLVISYAVFCLKKKITGNPGFVSCPQFLRSTSG